MNQLDLSNNNFSDPIPDSGRFPTFPASDYAILGDDIVIGHTEVAEQYKRLLKWIGVKIPDGYGR